jgi:hypothetical protein
MTNITLSVDEQIVKKVRKIAIDQNTTLTAMVREYLQSEDMNAGQRYNGVVVVNPFQD